jgi:hypothetical protein
VLRNEGDFCEYDPFAPEPRERYVSLRGPKLFRAHLATAHSKRPRKSVEIEELRAKVTHLEALLRRRRHLPAVETESSNAAVEDAEATVDSVGEQLNSLVLDRVLSPPREEIDTSASLLSRQVHSLFSDKGQQFSVERNVGLLSYELLLPSPTVDVADALRRLFPPRQQAFALLDTFLGFMNRIHCAVDPLVCRAGLDDLYSNREVGPACETGWLSCMLVIFALGLASSKADDVSLVPGNGRQAALVRWLGGALQGISSQLALRSASISLDTLRAVGLVTWL